MSSINSVRNLQIFYFSRKIKEIKKMAEKSGLKPSFIHTTNTS